MVDTTASRIGQINGAGADDALFLKLFAGEVLATFDRINVMKGLHRMRTITSGKSAQFPAIGKTVADYHQPGENILDPTNSLINSINHAERVITIDDLLVASTFVDNLEEMRNHYDVRSEYAHQLGEALALRFDTNLMQVVALAARASATVTGNSGGTSGGGALTNAAMKTDGSVLVSALFAAAQTLDEKDIPASDRVALVSPQQYYNLVRQSDVLDRDLGNDGNGTFKDGTVFKVAGFTIVKTNNLPDAVVSANTGENNTYDGDFSATAGLCFHKSAIGTVKLMDLAMESEYKMEYQGHFMLAKYALGHGILRPEAAVELLTS